MKQRLVRSIDDLLALEEQVVRSAEMTLSSLRDRLRLAAGLPVLATLKFDAAGCDPLDPERPLNFVEQLNQTFTYLASIEATRWLFAKHPTSAPFVLNLGTSPGSDVTSHDGRVVAETFAATHPDSNRKLDKDIAKVQSVDADFRYVFYLSPVEARLRASSDVTVVRLSHRALAPSAHSEA